MSEEQQQTLINEGTWKARPTGALLGYTKGGNDQVGIGFILLEGPSKGRSISYYGGFGEKSVEFTYQALRNSGWLGDDLADLSSIEGTEAEPYLVIAHEEYEGVTSARVKWVNSGGVIAMKERMGPGEAQAFAQRMKGSIMALNQKLAAKGGNGATGGGRPAANRSAGGGFVAPPPPNDDDIPF